MVDSHGTLIHPRSPTYFNSESRLLDQSATHDSPRQSPAHRDDPAPIQDRSVQALSVNAEPFSVLEPTATTEPGLISIAPCSARRMTGSSSSGTLIRARRLQSA